MIKKKNVKIMFGCTQLRGAHYDFQMWYFTSVYLD